MRQTHNKCVLSRITRPRLGSALVIGLVLYGSGTPECHAIVTIHDTSSHHTIDTQDQPGIVLSINVEC